MNQDEHKKIEQNMSFMKERLVGLDPLIDKLTKKGVFRFEHRRQIEKYSTEHRRFNEFIKILKASPNRDAFVCFLEALNADGHNAIVQKVQNTVPRQVGFVKTPGKVTVPDSRQTSTQQTPPPTSNVLLRTRHAPPTSNPQAVQPKRLAFAERSSIEPSQNVDISESGDLKTVLELYQQKQNMILERRTREIKQEQHDYMQEFFGQWQNEKYDIMKEISVLKKQYDNLKDKYDTLSARGTKNKDNILDDRTLDMKRSNEDLRNRCSKLSEENNSLQQECKRLNEKVEKQQSQITDLLQKRKEVESLVPPVIVEDMFDAGVDQEFGYAAAFGSHKKSQGKR